MSYDPDYYKTSQKLDMFIKIESESINSNYSGSASAAPRQVLVQELPQVKNLPAFDGQNDVDVFRTIYLVLLQLKFPPFVNNVRFVYWKDRQAKFEFYSKKIDES